MSIEAMRMALAFIRWNKFGECRVEGWDHPPPTAAEVDIALTNAIKQAEKEQADFQDFVSKVQEVEKQACEIINHQWVGLTDEEIVYEWELCRASIPRYVGFAKGIEAKLKEKNHVD